MKLSGWCSGFLSAEALDFIFLLDIDDLILLFKLKVYQYSTKAFMGPTDIISQLGIDMAGRALIRNSKYKNIHVINEASEKLFHISKISSWFEKRASEPLFQRV